MARDQHAADLACNFFELLLKHTADDYWGKPFTLMPWQEAALQHLFGEVDEDGKWLTQISYMELPKKAGKTEFAAGLVVMALALAKHPGFQVYGAAASQKQSLNVFRAACKMIEQSPDLSRRLRIMRGTSRIVKRNDPDSFYAAIAADGDFSDGMNPGFVVADEVHRWRTRKQMENWDVLTLSGVTRKQSMTVAITTAGVQSESPLAWRLHEKARQVKEGIISDPSFYGRIFGASAADNWEDEATWLKANPSLKDNGGFLDTKAIRKVFDAIANEADATAFRRYFLNIWDQADARAIRPEAWRKCAGELKSLINRPCYAGMDLSMTTDLTALTLLFPDQDGSYDVLPFFWLPEDRVRERERRDHVPYSQWIRDGFMETTTGDTVDQSVIEKKLHWAREMFELREVAYDPWNAEAMVTRTGDGLMDKGFRCVKIPQNFQYMSAPTKKLLELIAKKAIRHQQHPVLAWNADCLDLKGDGNDNVKPIKPERSKSDKRIDGVVALIMALSRAMLGGSPKSVYATRGLLGISTK